MDGGTEQRVLVLAPQLCKGTQMSCSPLQEFMFQDNIKSTLKPVKTVKFLTLTEEMACGFTGRERTVSASLLSYYLCLEICFIRDALLSINSLFLMSVGRMTSASNKVRSLRSFLNTLGLIQGIRYLRKNVINTDVRFVLSGWYTCLLSAGTGQDATNIT